MTRTATLALAALCTPSAGCLVAYSSRPVDVEVTRTDTGEPAVGVPVKASYGYMMVLNPPASAEGTTDASGRVTLPLADFLAGPSITAGTTRYAVTADGVRTGGALSYKSSANPDEPNPTYAVRLVARPKSYRLRVLDYLRRDGDLPSPPQ